MFVKLTVLACSIAAVLGVWNGPLAGGVPAHQFPAGVSPQACPNFPHCSNPALAANPNAPAPYNAAPQYNSYNPQPVPQYNPSLQSALDRGEYIGDGDYRGEGLAESGAYGNNGAQHGGWNQGQAGGWNQGQAGGWNQGQAGGWNQGQAGAWNQGQAGAWNQGHGGAAQVPAGVDSSACPNYPFCH